MIGPGDRGFAGAHGLQRGRAAVRLRRDIETDGRAVGSQRLEVFDDESIAVVRCQLPHGKVGFAPASLQVDERRLIFGADASDDPETAGARKLARDVARLRVPVEGLGVKVLEAGRDDRAACATQAVAVKSEALLEIEHRPARELLEPGIDDAVVPLALPAIGQHRQHDAGDEGSGRQPSGRACVDHVLGAGRGCRAVSRSVARAAATRASARRAPPQRLRRRRYPAPRPARGHHAWRNRAMCRRP